MARDWESQFRTWARPPSATETEKMQRAETAPAPFTPESDLPF